MLVQFQMQWFRTMLVLALAGFGCDHEVTASPQGRGGSSAVVAARSPVTATPVRTGLAAVTPDALCVTRGQLEHTHVAVPTFRAIAAGHGGDAASLRVRVHGASAHERALASGQHRRQVGLKLRAENGCNLVYVMWRLDPKPKLDVSLKQNPGQRSGQECGADGYTKVKPAHTALVPDLLDDQEHELAARIDGSALVVTVDGTVVWQGTLPEAAARLSGPAGIRSDNLDLDIVSFAAGGAVAETTKAACKGGGDEESD